MTTTHVPLPQHIAKRLLELPESRLIVATVRRIRHSEIEAGRLAHLSIESRDNAPRLPETIMPAPENGLWSKRNLQGHEVVFRDRPKQPKTITTLAPNFGDWSRGYHEMRRQVMTHPREFMPPRSLSLAAKILSTLPGEDPLYSIRFRVNGMLDRASPGWETDLSFSLNLLKENVGSANVYAADITDDDLLGVQRVQWNIFPAHESDSAVRIVRGIGDGQAPLPKGFLEERLDIYDRLKPDSFVVGGGGFQRYFGAVFGDLIVLECVFYGNAIYMISNYFLDYTRDSRFDFMMSLRERLVRIVHTKGWQFKLIDAIQRHRMGVSVTNVPLPGGS